MPRLGGDRTREPSAVFTLQRLAGNRALQTLSLRAPVLQRQPTPPDPQKDLIADAIAHFGGEAPFATKFDVKDAAFEGIKAKITKLRNIGNDALKARLAGLDQATRARVADAVATGVRAQVATHRQTTVAQIAEEFDKRIKIRLPQLAEVARLAEEAEPANLPASKRRPPFPLILKFILLRIVFTQIKEPREKPPRELGDDYGKPLGLATDDPVFPDIYDKALVELLKPLPPDDKSKMQHEVREAVSDKALERVADYFKVRVKVPVAQLRDEYAKFPPVPRALIEGGLGGYPAVRPGLFKAFGPGDVTTVFERIRRYFAMLVPAEFLQQGSKKPGGRGTLVHPLLKEAMNRAEELICKNGWGDEVLASIKKYWSTNLRENRNNITELSEHSFGMAVDINPENNPNLAKFGKDNWKYINELVGEDIFYDAHGKPIEAVQMMRQGLSDPDEIMAAIEKIRAQSDALVGVFGSESSLRARLADYLKRRGANPRFPMPAGPLLWFESPFELELMLDHAQQAVIGPKKERPAHEKELRTSLVNAISTRKPEWSTPPATTSPLAAKLVKIIGRQLKSSASAAAHEDLVKNQIMAPVHPAPRAATRAGLAALFDKRLVPELEAVATDDRPALAEEVLYAVRQPLALKDIDKEAMEIATFLIRGFRTLEAIQKRGKPGAATAPGMGAQGFANLSDKLVKALVLPDGGGLVWLGVHNQDMHHFELKKKPSLLKIDFSPPGPASSCAPAAPSPASAPSGAPAATPAQPTNPPELINPWP